MEGRYYVVANIIHIAFALSVVLDETSVCLHIVAVQVDGLRYTRVSYSAMIALGYHSVRGWGTFRVSYLVVIVDQRFPVVVAIHLPTVIVTIILHVK